MDISNPKFPYIHHSPRQYVATTSGDVRSESGFVANKAVFTWDDSRARGMTCISRQGSDSL